MSLDQTNAQPAETAAPEGRKAGVSMWVLAIPIAIVLAVAAVAFFLLSPKDDELMATTDQRAVAVAVANAQPAPPAFDAAAPAPAPR
jgi:flagellar basal body-associated protein FliL